MDDTEQRRNYLQSLGFDPDQYEYNGPIPGDTSTPTTTTQEPPDEEGLKYRGIFSPLVKAKQWSTSEGEGKDRPWATGLHNAMVNLAEPFTSPLSIGTLGLGGVAGLGLGLGNKALYSLGSGLSKAASVGFGADMALNTLRNVPQLGRDIMTGDPSKILPTVGSMLAGGYFGYKGLSDLKHPIPDYDQIANPEPKGTDTPTYTADQILGDDNLIKAFAEQHIPKTTSDVDILAPPKQRAVGEQIGRENSLEQAVQELTGKKPGVVNPNPPLVNQPEVADLQQQLSGVQNALQIAKGGFDVAREKMLENEATILQDKIAQATPKPVIEPNLAATPLRSSAELAQFPDQGIYKENTTVPQPKINKLLDPLVKLQMRQQAGQEPTIVGPNTKPDVVPPRPGEPRDISKLGGAPLTEPSVLDKLRSRLLQGEQPTVESPVDLVPERARNIKSLETTYPRETIINPNEAKSSYEKQQIENKLATPDLTQANLKPTNLLESLKLDPTTKPHVDNIEGGLKIKLGSNKEAGFNTLIPDLVNLIHKGAKYLGDTFTAVYRNLKSIFGPSITPLVPKAWRQAKKYAAGPVDLIGKSIKDNVVTTRDIPYSIPHIEGMSDTIRKTVDQQLGDATLEVKNKTKDYYSYANKVLDALSKLPAQSKQNVHNALITERETRKPFTGPLTPQEQQVKDLIRSEYKKLGEKAIELKMPIDAPNGPRLLQIDPYGYPQVVSSKVIELLSTHPTSSEAAKYKQDFIDNLMKYLPHSAPEELAASQIKALDSYEKLRAGYGLKTNQTHYGALSLPEGIPLPRSWIETDPMIAMSRYFHRAAKALAWHEVVMQRPDVAKQLGITTDGWENPIMSTKESQLGNPTVRSLMEQVYGSSTSFFQGLNYASRIASNSVMGPTTGIMNNINAAFNLLPYMRLQGLPAYVRNLGNIGKFYRQAIDNGAIQKDYSMVEEFISPLTNMAQKLNSIANLVSKVTTRQGFENISQAIAMAAADASRQTLTNLANKGHKSAQLILKDIAPFGHEQLAPELLNRRIAEVVTGKYDFTNNPNWILNSQFAPFFKLAKWSVEQTNNFTKHIITPAVKYGDVAPLLMTAGGMFLSGNLMKQAVEILNNKKDQIPDLKELALSGNKNTTASLYNYFTLGNLAGQMGAFMSLPQAMTAYMLNRLPQGYKYPMMEVLGDGINKIMAGVQAVANGDASLLEVGGQIFKEMAITHTQALRVGLNQLSNLPQETLKNTPIVGNYLSDYARDFEKNKKIRDVESFQVAQGQPLPTMSENNLANYSNLPEKEFRRTTDIPEAVKDLTQRILPRYLAKYKDNPDMLMNKLRSLKINSYPTMPNMETNPLTFSRYVDYLNKTKPSGYTQRLLNDFFLHQAINQAKSSMIP